MIANRMLTVSAEGAEDRATQLASLTGPRFVRALATYDRLFATAGVDPSHVEATGRAARTTLAQWAPDLASEVDHFAATLGVAPWHAHAVNARTEVLAVGARLRRAECSTIARTPEAGAVVGAQTWDWHLELRESWLVVRHEGGPLPFVTLTEAGILGKIGVNAAGVGLLFNILGHESDAQDGGVPVHAVARRVLDSARTLEEACDVVRSAPLAASSCFTVVAPDGVACLEASPSGVAVVPAQDGWVQHTNHFIDPVLARGDVSVAPEPDTVDRHKLLVERTRAVEGPLSPDQLAELLLAHEDTTGAPICCHAKPAASLGSRWQTLATVVVDPSAAAMTISPSGPCQVSEGGWSTVSAA